MIAVDVKIRTHVKFNLIFLFLSGMLSFGAHASDYYDFLSESQVVVIPDAASKKIRGLEFGEESGSLFSTSGKGTETSWNFHKRELVAVEPDGTKTNDSSYSALKKKYSKRVVGSILFIDATQDKSYTAVCTSKGFIKIYDKYDEEYQLIEVFDGKVSCIKLSPDGKRLYTGSPEGFVTVYDVLSGALKYIVKGHWDSVECIAVSPDQAFFAAGYGDGTLKVWSCEDNELVASFLQIKDGRWAAWSKNARFTGPLVATVKSAEQIPDLKEYNAESKSIFSNEAFNSFGVWFRQDVPLTSEKDFIYSKLGFGINLEKKSELPVGFSTNISFDAGVRRVEFINLWFTACYDNGIFLVYDINDKFAVQPEFHVGVNFNTIRINSDVCLLYKPVTVDFILMPAVEFQYRLSPKDRLEVALYSKMAIEYSECVTDLGYRLGYKRRF